MKITTATPGLGVPGGEVWLGCQGFEPGIESRVLVGTVEAEIVSASDERVLVRLPSSPEAVGVALVVRGEVSPAYPFLLARKIADGLHPVSSPVVAPDGSVITTVSGSRGEAVPNPLVRITAAGEKIPYGCEIMNPTGLAFGADGQLYISSRHDGVVVRYRDFAELEIVAEGLGIACGIAFDSKGVMYAGDRSGRIYQIAPSGQKREFAELEPSVSAYHLVFDAEDHLYVTGPTLAVRDALYRISPEGDVEVLVTGLGRPQGMARAQDGSILVTAAYQGRKGVFRVSAGGRLEHYVAGPTLVGVATWGGRLFLVDKDAVYRLELVAERVV